MSERSISAGSMTDRAMSEPATSSGPIRITVSADAASDSWGFVGVVGVGNVEAYRTIEAFATPAEATAETEVIVGGVLGELLAGAEWRKVRESTGRTPTRRDLALDVFNPRNPRRPSYP